jgi:CheY-like chemotaxis protein
MTADSADDAIAKLRSSAEMLPDILLSDLAMPQTDGYAMIKRIRELSASEGGRVPALALSAFSSPENRRRAIEAGFQSYSTKPFEPETLIPEILELTNGRTSSRKS